MKISFMSDAVELDPLLASQASAATSSTEMDVDAIIPAAKSRSFVWKHVDRDGMKATCGRCKSILTINKHTISNLISHFSKHGISQASSAAESVIKVSGRQLTIKEAVNRGFNQEEFNRSLSNFPIKSDAPFLTVEHPDFISLMQCMNPAAEIPCATTCQRRMMKLFGTERIAQANKWSSVTSKFSFGMDIWSSPNGIPFIGITAHYIDNDWKLQCKLFDFIPFMSSHTGRAIYEEFDKALDRFGMKQKLLTISVDNATNNDSFITIMIQKYPSFTKEHHIRCFAHVLNLAAQQIMKEQDARIERLRNLMKEFRLSPLKKKSLQELFESLEMEGKFVTPIMDSPTRWNSTFDMIERPLRLKQCIISY